MIERKEKETRKRNKKREKIIFSSRERILKDKV